MDGVCLWPPGRRRGRMLDRDAREGVRRFGRQHPRPFLAAHPDGSVSVEARPMNDSRAVKPFRLSRRALLRGAGGAAIALPWLEAMGDSRASAATSPRPKRFLGVYTPG